MKKQTTLASMDRAVLREWVNKADGWTIWDADAMITAGFPREFVDGITRTYKSDYGDPKATIFTDGEAVAELRGVYALPFLYRVCAELGVDPKSTAIGRGFQAREVQRSLNEWFKQQENGEVQESANAAGARENR